MVDVRVPSIDVQPTDDAVGGADPVDPAAIGAVGEVAGRGRPAGRDLDAEARYLALCGARQGERDADECRRDGD
jgi:hypothetical protein